jgi:hypothetical protein
MKSVIVVFFVFVVSLMIFTSLYSQDQLPPRGPAADRIAQFKKVRLMEVLKFDEETAIRFFARYTKHEESLRAIQKDHNVLIDRLQDLIQSHGSNSEMEQVIKEIGVSEEKISETRSNFLEELKDIISVKQVAQYVVFERNFNKNLRDIMRDIAKERRNRPM